MTGPCCTYDFTLKESVISLEALKQKLKEICKSWTFQLEQGEKTGFLHYQGRISLKTKLRIGTLIKSWNIPETHFSITTNENRDNNFYVMKQDTRKGGPWSDKDPYIPRQVRDIKDLLPWQQEVVDSANAWDTRTINIIVDHCGNIGKSTLSTYLNVFRIGRSIPPCNDFKDIMRIVMNTEKMRLYLFDIPRALPKKNLCFMYGAIEKIKDGYCFDDRYSFQEEYFDCPNVWVFTNELPKLEWLSNDRWKFWHVNKSGMLCEGRLTQA